MTPLTFFSLNIKFEGKDYGKSGFCHGFQYLSIFWRPKSWEYEAQEWKYKKVWIKATRIKTLVKTMDGR